MNRPVRSEFVDAIYTLTDGNPFFVEELLRSLPVAGDGVPLDERCGQLPPHELRLPRSVHDTVLRRTTASLRGRARRWSSPRSRGGCSISTCYSDSPGTRSTNCWTT